MSPVSPKRQPRGPRPRPRPGRGRGRGRFGLSRRRALGLLALIAGAGVLGAGASALRRRGAFRDLPDPGPPILMPRDRAPVPPGRPLRLAVLGTSLTARGDWPERLAEALSVCRPSGVALNRVAKPGAASDWGAQAAERALAMPQGGAPDILLIEFAINDASLIHGVDLDWSLALHRRMLDQAQAAAPEARIFLTLPNPAYGRPAWVRPGLGAYVAALRRLAERRGLGFVDARAPWDALPEAQRQALMPDDLHPTPEGMARLFLPLLVEALSPLACP